MMRTGSPMRLGHAESPVVEKTLDRRFSTKNARLALSWGIVNFLVAAICYIELTFGSIARFFEIDHPAIWYIELFLATLFTLNAVVDFARYLGPTTGLTQQPIALSPQQRRLLGVGPNAVGFRTSPSSSHPCTPPSTSKVTSLPSSMTVTTTSPMASPAYSSLYSTPSVSFLNPSGYSGSYPSTPYLTHSASYSTTPQHSSFTSVSRPTSGSPRTSSTGINFSPLFRDSPSTSSLRPRHQSSPGVSSPDERITDMTSLNSYLKNYDEKEQWNHLASGDTSPGSSPSYWSYNRSASDYTPVLRKYQYQIASRSPKSQSSRNDDDPDYPATFAANESWAKLGVVRDAVEEWIENLRKWIAQTVLKNLMKEIEEINTKLRQMGSAELQIGEVGITSLRQISQSKCHLIPSLPKVLSYLDVSANQEYLIQRLAELSQGGCMSDFRWNGGGDYRGRKWDHDLPTDCVILQHLLCTYLDSQLPPHPKYPDGKTFTNQYFMKTPDKPDLKKKDNILIFQSKINPPHYKVIIGDDTWDVPKGRSNMFQAILLFFHHIKTKEHGMLGRVNLSSSGVNILWILDS
ncbi:transmembrane protein 209-like [Saccoglossus kowalevskii]|uniref:Transmembrane protein 209-like n=1 Tax=Saccoglossus kowalevskii TaxID=10224 RepID=A0ABM0GIV3_SACKO|nr:PREDICTED: transmembrane protein 209-like [Saccoglossus kowalevskii]